MIEVTFSSSFKRSFKKVIKNNKSLEEKFWLAVELFCNDPFNERLHTHKLSGKLKGLWAFRIDYDLRLIFFFSDKDHAVFTDVGKHDEVY